MDAPPSGAEVDAAHDAQEDEDEEVEEDANREAEHGQWEDEADEDEEEDMTPKQRRDWLLVEKLDSVFGLFETLVRRQLSAVARRVGFRVSRVMVGGVICWRIPAGGLMPPEPDIAARSAQSKKRRLWLSLRSGS
jgi:hypothetical protein